jgi:hypothetical protein
LAKPRNPVVQKKKVSNRGTDAYMERMKKAREEKEAKRLITERGIPSQQKKPVPGGSSMAFGRDKDKFKDNFDQMHKERGRDPQPSSVKGPSQFRSPQPLKTN